MANKNYNIAVFNKGTVRLHVRAEASTPLQAFKFASKPASFSHALVVDKVIKRYDKKGKKINDTMYVCKTLWKGISPAIILMIGVYPEVYKFSDKNVRDKIFEEMNKCITSMYAGSAKAEEELTDIIVSLEEIKGTRKNSMSKKTSSGSATSVTCRAMRILESIDSSSGTTNVADTDLNTWFNGSKVYLSERNPILPVTVNLSKVQSEYIFPGLNEAMKLLNGKSMKVSKGSIHNGVQMFKALGNTWMWHPMWLDNTRAYFKVIHAGKNSDEVTEKEVGKIFKATVCGCGCGNFKIYTNRGVKYAKPSCFEDGYSQEDYDKQNMEVGRTNNR